MCILCSHIGNLKSSLQKCFERGSANHNKGLELSVSLQYKTVMTVTVLTTIALDANHERFLKKYLK